MKPVPPCRPPSPRRNCGGYPPLSPLILPISPINMGTVIHLNPHWSSLSPDVVKRFNYDVPLPAGVGCSYIINSSSTLDGMSLPPIVLCRAERTSISTVTADQQVAAGPESVLPRARAEDRKVTPKLCYRRETVLLCRNQCILVPILGRKHPFPILKSHFFGDDPVRKNFDDVENAMDQAVKTGIRVTRTWGPRDLNVT